MTTSRLVPVIVDFSFSNFQAVQMESRWQDLQSSTFGLDVRESGGAAEAEWSLSVSLVDPERLAATPAHFIPGDTLTGQLSVEFRAFANIDDGVSGSGRIRLELLTVVPEPSAALSLPIGVLCLAGLASMRGSA